MPIPYGNLNSCATAMELTMVLSNLRKEIVTDIDELKSKIVLLESKLAAYVEGDTRDDDQHVHVKTTVSNQAAGNHAISAIPLLAILVLSFALLASSVKTIVAPPPVHKTPSENK